MIWCMYASDPPFAAETVFQIYFQDFLHYIKLGCDCNIFLIFNRILGEMESN